MPALYFLSWRVVRCFRLSARCPIYSISRISSSCVQFAEVFLWQIQLTDPFQAIVASHKALKLYKQEKMKTKTLHSEVVFNLSPSNNVSAVLIPDFNGVATVCWRVRHVEGLDKLGHGMAPQGGYYSTGIWVGGFDQLNETLTLLWPILGASH